MVVGFVWPKWWLGSFGQNGGWVRLAKMVVGFVWPKWRLGSFGQNGGWVRLAKTVVGFVWPKWWLGSFGQKCRPPGSGYRAASKSRIANLRRDSARRS